MVICGKTNQLGETMKKRYYSAVIFDVDGLLLDTERLTCTIWQQISKEYGCHLSDELYQSFIGRTRSDTEGLLLGAFGPDFPVEEAYEKRTTYFIDYAKKNGLPQKPGVDVLLNYLAEMSVPVCVATSAGNDVAELKLKSGGLARYFDKVVTGDDVSEGKPSPDIFMKAAGKMQIDPEKCVVIEDSVAGIFAAKRANMIPIMVPDIVYPEPEVKKMTLVVLHSLKSVKKYIQNLSLIHI